MSDKELAWTTLLVAAVGTVVICVLAYRLNEAQGKLNQATSDPWGTVRRALGV